MQTVLSEFIDSRSFTKKITSARRAAEASLPTKYGRMRIVGYENLSDGSEHVAIVHGDISATEAQLVRIHSECFTGDIFGSLRCDCGPQLDAALKLIVAEGSGIVVYLRQEGRGIGLLNKIRAYALQEQGLDTVEANLALGFAPDSRDYSVGSEILADLGVTSIRLLSNNPEKVDGLSRCGISVVERVPLVIQPAEENLAYMQTKETKMGHLYRILGETLVVPVEMSEADVA